jgi:hypothetical protein
LSAAAGRTPLGAVFAGIGLVASAGVGLLRLDRLPFPVCYMKALTGWPCPSCGTTRALGRLFALDVAGAFAMNPLATFLAFLLAGWGLLDLCLVPFGRALRLELSPESARRARFAALVLVVANWIFLMAAGR